MIISAGALCAITGVYRPLAHRERMVKAYFPNASEQTIILSTDAEIDRHYYKLLKPSIGKEFTLKYDDTTKSTIITEGYFGGEQHDN